MAKDKLSNISCLPQGDSASPMALLAPLAEVQMRIKQKHPRCISRISLDDRKFFTTNQKSLLQIAKLWRNEVRQLGLNENQGKADFALLGTPKQRRTLQNALQAQGIPGQVKLRPKLLGTRIDCRRRFPVWMGKSQELLRQQTLPKSFHARYCSN